MQIPRRYDGKAALITGGASGIGLASAIRMAREGASVAIADINPETAQSACQTIEAEGGQSLYTECDVTKAEDNERMVSAAVARFGKLDVLVTCAGMGAGGNVDSIDEADWDRVVDLDLKGVFLSSRYALPAMRQNGGGAMAHISSIGGLVGMSGASFCAAKAGVVNLTRQMGRAHAHENIRVNCICPGVIDTPLVEGWLTSSPGKREEIESWHPMNRLGTAEEVAAAAAFLCADEASFITGAILAVDGGYMCTGPGR